MTTAISKRAWMALAVAGVAAAASVVSAEEGASMSQREDALSAAWPGMVEGATVIDWEGKGLQEGDNGYTCLPSPQDMAGNAPMCLDEVWMAWAKAWQNKEPFTADRLGIAYMLAGDAGASNLDPFAMEATDDNQWVVEGPHLMIVAPPGLLDAFPTDPDSGGPYLMWKGTDYQHLMVPMGARPVEQGME
ncbi:hypothetical protein [Halomonas getboli]|uniref:hypothetical protein n=1 Tax=Halomonas getboli TaxID=2935862 RepID=UPI001FFFB576|nr:hypothetical protein [Halomonas getboli]MCK2184685.1 hypothetical protein [Halomonas getboli]